MQSPKPLASPRADYRSAIGLVLIAGVAWLVHGNAEAFARVSHISPRSIALLTGAHLLNYLCIGWVHAVCLRAIDLRLSPREWIGLSFVTAIYDLILPARAGMLFRAWYLRRTRGLELARFVG